MRLIVSSSLALLIFPAATFAQGVERLSLDTAGGDADAASSNRSISADGRYVAFASSASDLVAGDGNGVSDVFVRDRLLDVTTRVSVDTAGGDANGASLAPAISADGRFVAFVSSATDLVASDGNGRQDVFLRDLLLDTTIRISVDQQGGDADGDSVSPWVDGDGDVVVFASSATDLITKDSNNHQDVFVRDLDAGVTTRVSESSSGTQANNRSIRPSVSHDGRRVAFSSLADNLVVNDGNVRADVFLHDRDDGTTVRVSVNDNGWGGNGTSGDAEISGDGTKVVFDSLADNLAGSDLNQRSDVFLRDLVAGTTIRLSVDAAGLEGDDDSVEATVNFDGSIVAFTSEATNLVENDGNGVADVFMCHLDLGILRRLSVSNLGAEADAPCGQPAMSADGQVVSFDSAGDVLDPNDGNGFGDVHAHATCTVEFTEFGVGLAGAGGLAPHLFGDDGSGFHGAAVHLRDGVGFAQGLIWIGLGTVDQPLFKGHFYIDLAQPYAAVPILLGGVLGQPGDGEFDLDGGDLTAFAGITAYVQVALVDPAAPKGISLSNALQVDLVSR